MENTVDSYLHKKFKKQLNIEPRPAANDRGNKNGAKTVERTREERPVSLENCYQVNEISCRTDNTHIVPNTSTNLVNDRLNVRNDYSNVRVDDLTVNYDSSNVRNDILIVKSDSFNVNKSSISLENPLVTSQSHNISYVPNIHRYEVNFDTKFSSSDVVSNSYGQKSSILDANLYKYNYEKSDDKVSPEREQTNRENDRKQEETQPQTDKSTGGGKYVCTYCNLACSKPSVLQKHIRAHTNERPYPCVSCGFSFKTRSNLYKHCRSRTHANRVLGSKARGEILNDDTDPNSYDTSPKNEVQPNETPIESHIDYKTVLYKPRFHTTSKVFYEQPSKENAEDESRTNSANSDILSHHINEVISKNNSKNTSSDTYLLKRKPDDSFNSEYANVPQRIITRENDALSLKLADEPLNLTNKGRKRCMSEAIESKSLIKEILLKNLSSDMQCPHCKMIFQTVTELELHKLRSCKGFVKPGAKYSRSSSVNVASILTQNKNAFDNIPQMQAVFPLKSPGPFLGNTRLVENDKAKSFSFDDGLANVSMYPATREITSSRYLLSPLTLQNDSEKRPPIKLFGGEVKITQNTGDSKSFKIDNKNDGFESNTNFLCYGGKMSENRVIRSGLHSGGTVLTNKGNFTSDSVSHTHNVIRMYESSISSPTIDVSNIGKKSSYVVSNTDSSLDRKKPPDLVIYSTNEEISSPSPYMKYPNIIDFSQNAVKLLTPNLKQPNLMLPGLPVPNQFTYNTPESRLAQPLKIEIDVDNNNLHNSTRNNYQERTSTPDSARLIPKKFQFPSQETESQPSNMYNPMNILVNGKVVRYVPGMPGPVVAEAPLDMGYVRGRSTPTKVSPSHRRVSVVSTPTPMEVVVEVEKGDSKRMSSPSVPKLLKQATFDRLEVKTDSPTKNLETRSPKLTEMRSPVIKMGEMKSPVKIPATESKKFVRPNSLALKPTSASLKQHHGLTPTMFNQILISPDTPRVAKKYVQQYLNGNYFSYLGLKSTTKPVYCTLNKTQPFYVPHFKKLSMYSEWRQQDTKTDKLYVAGYNSRQTSSRYTVAGQKGCGLVAHSSYKFTSLDSLKDKEESLKSNSILGGYECNDDYTYIRGRGRGRYVCEQCGIRCKKPSMLKKHIRTHSNDRPYTCSHCNFSFKTKGNLTKHMKSKAHNKNSTTSSSSGSSTQLSGTPSSESETEDSGMDSSDESTRHQEHEAAYGLLSLSQKSTHNITSNTYSPISTTSPITDQSSHQLKMEVHSRVMNTEEIAFVTKTNYAKNKFLEHPTTLKLSSIKEMAVSIPEEKKSNETNTMVMFLGKSSGNRPLTYPYVMSEVQIDEPMSVSSENTDVSSRFEVRTPDSSEPKCIKQFHVIQRYAVNDSKEYIVEEASEPNQNVVEVSYPEERLDSSHYPMERNERTVIVTQNLRIASSNTANRVNPPVLKVNDNVVYSESSGDVRKRKLPEDIEFTSKLQKNEEVMDLSVNAAQRNADTSINLKMNGMRPEIHQNYKFNYDANQLCAQRPSGSMVPEDLSPQESVKLDANDEQYVEDYPKNNGNVLLLNHQGVSAEDEVRVVNYVVDSQEAELSKSDSPKPFQDFDNSAMETLADIATKQVKLEKNAMAKSVASEYLKLATKQEFPVGENERFPPKEVNDLIVKPEGSKSCTICAKSFSKPSQLRLHMNVHYLERPFRCDSCSVSFRTKGHLQKHERSASHHNKLSSSPALSSSEPRPFKCADCNIAFRIHGHLAKHLRSKMHIMKLECLAKIPFGLYAELERSNSLLTEINTADGDQCLESLKTLAKKVFLTKKVFMNDPGKLNHITESPELLEAD